MMRTSTKPCSRRSCSTRGGVAGTSPNIAMRRSLVYRREARLSESVRAVARFVMDTIQEHAARIRGTPQG
jgi:hypothetical protein